MTKKCKKIRQNEQHSVNKAFEITGYRFVWFLFSYKRAIQYGVPREIRILALTLFTKIK